MKEYYEINVAGYDSIFVYDTQQLIYEQNELVNGYGVNPDDIQVVTHERS